MQMKSGAGGLAAAIVGLLIGVSSAQAQATRTWVSGVGDDANPCSRTAPCKTFAGAISKTAAQGEISVLDPGGYGAVTITKSISIVGDGSEASILATTGASGIIINAGLTDTVNITGLIIEGANTGLNGIRITQAGNVTVNRTLIRGFGAANGSGILVQSTTGGVRLHLNEVQLYKNVNGLNVKSTDFGAAIQADRSMFVQNSNGIVADGAKSLIRLRGSTVTHNGVGLTLLNTGKIVSFGDNVLQGNNTNGAVTQTVPLE